MSMSVAPAGEDDGNAPMNEINTTPLVDVMLVLLIIFMITVPVALQTVPLALPKVTNLPTATKPENLLLAVKATGGDCETYWGTERITETRVLVDRAVAKLTRDIAAQGGPSAPGLLLPEVHIRGDANAPYKCAGAVIFAMQSAGFQKVGFISEPVAGTVTR